MACYYSRLHKTKNLIFWIVTRVSAHDYTVIKIVNIGFEIWIFFHPISMRLILYCFCSKNDIYGIENSFHKVFVMHRILYYKKPFLRRKRMKGNFWISKMNKKYSNISRSNDSLIWHFAWYCCCIKALDSLWSRQIYT